MKIQVPTSSVDIFPTVLDLLNIQYSKADIDGRSVVPTFKDPSYRPHEYIFSETVKGIIRVVYKDEYKYIKPFPWDWATTEDHLYKAWEDYLEKNDLKEKEPELKTELENLLDSWIEISEKKENYPAKNLKKSTQKQKKL